MGINIGFKYTSTIKSSLVKNKTSVGNTAEVYKIPCKDCSLVYVGETGLNIDTRIKEHKYAIRTGNINNAVFKHMYDTNHKIAGKIVTLLTDVIIRRNAKSLNQYL